MLIRSFRQEFNNPFVSLENVDYRIYWLSSAISSIGIWMQMIAFSWLAYRLTDSALLLGIVSAVHYLPSLLLSLFAGAIIDRFPSKIILLITHIIGGLLLIIMWFLIHLQALQLWQVIIIAFLAGVITSIILPLRQVYVNELVEKHQLLNAVALYATVYNLARFVGPALGGFIIAWTDIGNLFLITGLLFFATPIAILLIKKPSKVDTQSVKTGIMAMVKTGVRYSMKDQRIKDIIFIAGIIGVFGINFSVLLPIVATEIFHGGEIDFGLLMSAVGLGTLIGALTVAASSNKDPKKMFLYQGALLLGGLLIVIGIFPVDFLIFICLTLIGFLYVAFATTAATALQLYSIPDNVGRVMGIYNLMMVGASPIGNLYSGGIANFAGIRWAFITCGLGLLFFYLIYFFNKKKNKTDDVIVLLDS